MKQGTENIPGKKKQHWHSNNFESSRMHRKIKQNYANDTMLLQEALIQQRIICFLWNSKRFNL